MSGRTGVTTLPSSTAAGRRHAAPRRPSAERHRVALIVVAELVLSASALLLLYLGWYLVVDDRIVAAEQTGAADAQVRAWDAAPITDADAPVDPAPGDTFAVIRVPRFGADWRRPLVEGTSSSELDRGVGHYTGTALPGRSATSRSPGTASPTAARSPGSPSWRRATSSACGRPRPGSSTA